MKMVLILIALIAVFLLYLNYRPQPAVSVGAPISSQVLETLPKDRKGQVLIYGAYGYTGTQIAKLAKSYGIKPVLSGRDAQKLKKLVDELGYDYVSLTLENNHDNLVKVLKHFEVVLHIAGPYTYTAKSMLDACVEAKTHYLDITGENHVIQQMIDRDDEFKRANIQVMPAVGFDVVPTDSLNVYVAQKITNPTRLQVFINADVGDIEGTRMSQGTAKSGLEIINRPLYTREKGSLVKLSSFKRVNKTIDGRERTFLQIAWPDVLISYISTGVPTIETYITGPGSGMSRWILGLAQFRWGRTVLGWMIGTLPKGPEKKAQTNREGLIVSIVTNDAGDKAIAQLTTPEGYLFTSHSTLLVAKQIIDGKWQPGFQAVGKVYGPDLVLKIPGVTRQDITAKKP